MNANRSMVNARRALAANVTATFLPLELSADETAAQALRCVATLIEVRRNAGLAVTAGEDVLATIHEGCKLAFEAQALFRRAHAQMLPLAGELGIETAVAPTCPGEVFMGNDGGNLRIVA